MSRSWKLRQSSPAIEASNIEAHRQRGLGMTSLLSDLYAALEQTRDAPRLSLPQGSPSPRSLICSSAAESEPHANRTVHPPVRVEPLEDNGPQRCGPSGLAALTSDRLRTIVREAREYHGPHHVRWTLRERLAWQELVVTRGEAA
jgi:hypothetical protein